MNSQVIILIDWDAKEGLHQVRVNQKLIGDDHRSYLVAESIAEDIQEAFAVIGIKAELKGKRK